METVGKKISAEACSGKEIAGLLRKMMMMRGSPFPCIGNSRRARGSPLPCIGNSRRARGSPFPCIGNSRDDEYDDTKILKSRRSGFSRGKLEAGRNELGLCTARYESKGCC